MELFDEMHLRRSVNIFFFTKTYYYYITYFFSFVYLIEQSLKLQSFVCQNVGNFEKCGTYLHFFDSSSAFYLSAS